MRRPASSSLVVALSFACAGLLPGCTGTGVFFDHTSQWFGANPNTPAGSSETFLRIRGDKVDVPPLTPEAGNVWPDDTRPDKTMQDLEKQQNEEIRRNGQPAPGGADPAGGANPQRIDRANSADRGLPPPRIPPPAKAGAPTVQTPNGPAPDVTGQGTGQGTGHSGGGILVPNGNGTSTLIGPDGSVQTVPTKP